MQAKRAPVSSKQKSLLYDYYISHAQVVALYCFPSILTVVSSLLLISTHSHLLSKWMVIYLFTAYYIIGLTITICTTNPSLGAAYAIIASIAIYSSLQIIANGGNIHFQSVVIIGLVAAVMAYYVVHLFKTNVNQRV